MTAIEGHGWDCVCLDGSYCEYFVPTPRQGPSYAFEMWDGTTLVISVDDEDPGDMGEPRTFIDYENGPTTYTSARAVQEQP